MIHLNKNNDRNRLGAQTQDSQMMFFAKKLQRDVKYVESH